MIKEKLIDMRKARGFSTKEIANEMNMTVSSYHRREKGKTKIHTDEGKKLAKIMNVPMEEIYEPEDKQSVIFNDNATATVTYLGTNNIYAIPESLLETLHKYIHTLEEKIVELEEKIAELERRSKS
jgi:transcriptional regulator with XRE-family HTH domain